MATTIEQVKEFLDECELIYRHDEEHDAILLSFSCDTELSDYRTLDGDAAVRLVIRLPEHGEFFTVFSPNAWNLTDCPHRAAVFEALVGIQTRYKMMRFDYDPEDGEVRPNIEMPLEDSSLTTGQFHRMLHGILSGIQRFDRVIRRAMESGEVSFADVVDEPRATPADDERAKLADLARRAGGIEALEKLLGGGEEAGESGTAA